MYPNELEPVGTCVANPGVTAEQCANDFMEDPPDNSGPSGDPVVDGLVRRRNGVLVRYVDVHGEGRDVVAEAHLGSGLLRALAVEIQHHDGPTVLGKSVRCRASDASFGSCTGDHRCPV